MFKKPICEYTKKIDSAEVTIPHKPVQIFYQKDLLFTAYQNYKHQKRSIGSLIRKFQSQKNPFSDCFSTNPNTPKDTSVK